VTKHLQFPDPHQQQHRELQVLHEVARTLTASLDLDQVLRGIMQQMSQAFLPESWTLLTLDEEAQQLVFAAGAEETLEHKRIPVGEGVAGWVALHGEPLILNNPQQDARYLADPQQSGQGRRAADSVVCLPLRARGRTQGVIQLVNCKMEELRPQQIFLLQALCDYAAIAIQNARVLEQVQRLTITDDCTGLYNARHMYAMLELALERCAKKHQPVGLIFLDLDHFKEVNDTHGHLHGSKLLAEVATLVRNNIGPLCSAFRYGGDEFVILLPNMGKESCMSTARLLLDLIQKTSFLAEAGLAVRLGASFGVACAPEDGQGLHAIIRAADAAMYAVKNSTRNGVQGAGSTPATAGLQAVPAHSRHEL
jgi:diguanylate cyclase (GGDEF)-like protein